MLAALSVTERAGYLARIRNMARSVAKIFVAEREKLGFPLLNKIKVYPRRQNNMAKDLLFRNWLRRNARTCCHTKPYPT